MHLTAVRLGGRPDLPLLVLGPAPGTTARELWSDVAPHLAHDFQVVAWDLPGHGTNASRVEPVEPVEDAAYDVRDLAVALLDLVGTMAGGFQPPRFHHVGVSLGGAVGLQLLLDAPQRMESVAFVGPLDAAVEGTSDQQGHAAARAALAGFDLPGHLERLAVPVLAGDPREAAADVARLVREHVLGPEAAAPAVDLDDRSRALVVAATLLATGHDHPPTDLAPGELEAVRALVREVLRG